MRTHRIDPRQPVESADSPSRAADRDPGQGRAGTSSPRFISRGKTNGRSWSAAAVTIGASPRCEWRLAHRPERTEQGHLDRCGGPQGCRAAGHQQPGHSKGSQRQRPRLSSGHCPQVKLSGYLLGGGMAWNQGVWGSARKASRPSSL